MFGYSTKIRKMLEEEEEIPLSEAILKRLEDVGVVREKLTALLDADIFDVNYTSKHDPSWYSKDKQADEKLDVIRRAIMSVSENLYEIDQILNRR